MTRSTNQRAKTRWLIWLMLLALSGWLAWEQPGIDKAEDGAVVQARIPILQPVSPQPVATDVSRVSVLLVPRNELFPTEQQIPQRDLFASVDWTPPPPPAPVLEPPPPVAPQLPFTYIGKRQSSDTWQIFLGLGDEVLIVQEGQTLANQYRVDSVAPPLMTLTYLPLGQTQTLAIGETR